MRPSAAEKVRSASASAGCTTSLSSAECGQRRLVGVLDGAGGAQDVVGGDAPALARELVAAARPADAFEDAVAHQRLQHRLEMARRQAWRAASALAEPAGRGR